MDAPAPARVENPFCSICHKHLGIPNHADHEHMAALFRRDNDAEDGGQFPWSD